MRNSEIHLVTGATSGLGLEAARALARDGRRHVLAGARNPDAASALREAVPAERLTVLPLDLASLASVRAFAAGARQRLGGAGARLSGVACNGGIQLTGPLRRSADGLELTFATNHLGHFLLVHELLDLLAPGAAVVSTASGTHDPDDRGARLFGFRGGVFPSADAVARGGLDASVSEKQQGMDRYATSKLCNVLFAYAMAARVPASAARFLALDPGLMAGTGLARGRSPAERFAWSHVMPLAGRLLPGASTPARSGAALARLLAEPDLAPGTGLHFDSTLRRTPTSALSRREDAQDDLHRTSLALCGLAEERGATAASAA